MRPAFIAAAMCMIFMVGCGMPIKRVTYSGDIGKGIAETQGEIMRQSAIADAMKKAGGQTRLNLAQPPGRDITMRQTGDTQNFHVHVEPEQKRIPVTPKIEREIVVEETQLRQIELPDGHVYTLNIEYTDHYIYYFSCFNKSDGSVRWGESFAPGGAGVDTGAAIGGVAVYGKYVVFSYIYNGVAHVETDFIELRDKATGSLVWRNSWSPATQPAIVPVAIDATGIYGASADYAAKLSLADGSIIWDAVADSGAWSLCVDSKYVYVQSYASAGIHDAIAVFDKKTGDKVSSTPIISGVWSFGITAHEKYLYVVRGTGSTSGDAYIQKLLKEDFSVVWTGNSHSFNGGSLPAQSNKLNVVATDNAVYMLSEGLFADSTAPHVYKYSHKGEYLGSYSFNGGRNTTAITSTWLSLYAMNDEVIDRINGSDISTKWSSQVSHMAAKSEAVACAADRTNENRTITTRR